MQTLAFVFLLFAWLNGLHIGPWVSWHSEVLVFVASVCAVLGVLAHHAKTSGKSVPIPYSTLIWPVLTVLAVFQLLAGRVDFHGDVVLLGLYFALMCVALVWGFDVGAWDAKELTTWSDSHLLAQLAGALLIGAFASTVIASVQTLDVWGDFEWIARSYSLRRPGGNMNQPNQLATLQLMGIVSLAYLSETRVIRGMAATLLYGVLIAGLGLTESRTGVVSAMVLAAFCIAHRKRYLGGRATAIAIGGVLYLIICFKFLPQGSHYLQQAGLPEGSALSANVSVGTRLEIWPQLIEASWQHPWFGWGLRQVPMAHNAVLHNYSVGEAFTYAHSIVLDLILGMGYPLAIVCIGLVCMWGFRRLRAIRDASSWYCMALLIPFTVHSLFEFPFAYAYFLLPIGFAMGFLDARLAPESVMKVSWRWAASASAVLIVLMAWSVWEYIQVEEDFRVARMEALRIGKTPASYDRPHLVLLDQMDAMLSGIRLVPAPGMAPETIELARKVALRFPWVATQNRYALALALNDNPEESIRQLKVMRAMHGEKTYAGIKAAWQELADTRYPLLSKIAMP